MKPYQKEIEAYFDARQEELVEAISRLVAIPSVKGDSAPGAPFGPGPAAALEEALKLAEEWGLTAHNHQGYVGTADLGEGEAFLHILGHLDVVGPGSGWTVTQPYQAKVVDGCIYGRGTDDDKGPVVCAMLAMRAVKDLGVPLERSVRLIMGTDEESGSADIAWYFQLNPYAPCTFTPDSGFPVINTEKGRYHPQLGGSWEKSDALPRVTSLKGGFRVNVVPPEAAAVVAGVGEEEAQAACRAAAQATGAALTVRTVEGGVEIAAQGKNAHASTPEEGVNAITALLAALKELPLAPCPSTHAVKGLAALFPHGDWAGKALGVAQEDAISGPLTVNLAIVELGDTGVTAHVDCRVPLCANEDNCTRVFEAALAKAGLAVTGEGKMVPGHHVPGDSHFVSTLLEDYTLYSGNKGECLSTGGGTYVHNIPGGVAFGCGMPGFDTHLHGPDERARLSDMLTSCKIFAQVIVDLCAAQ